MFHHRLLCTRCMVWVAASLMMPRCNACTDSGSSWCASARKSRPCAACHRRDPRHTRLPGRPETVPSQQPRGARPQGFDSGVDGYVIFANLPLRVVKPHMRAHYLHILASLPQRVADNAVFRSPAESTTFGVRSSTLDLVQLNLQSARHSSTCPPPASPIPWTPPCARPTTGTPAHSIPRGRLLRPVCLVSCLCVCLCLLLCMGIGICIRMCICTHAFICMCAYSCTC